MIIRTGKQNNPRRVLIYGENGIGKSTFAASMPTPLVMNMEDGIGDIEVDHTDKMKSLADFVAAISWTIQNDRTHRTIVVDTVDWLEKLVFAKVAEQAGKKTIEEIGYGKGYESVEREWKFLLEGLSHLWNQGRHIVFVAHARVSKFKTNPEGGEYNYWAPSLHEKGSECILQWCDEVLFAHTKVFVKTEETGFNQKRNVAVGGKDRVLICNDAAAHVAKNRLGLPDEIPLSYSEFSKYLKPLRPLAVKQTESQPQQLKQEEEQQQAAGNISGIVNDGSSKITEMKKTF